MDVLWVLFMLAVIVISVALVPTALAVMWFLLPWMLLVIAVGLYVLGYYLGSDDLFGKFFGWVGISSGLVGLLMLFAQGYFD